ARPSSPTSASARWHPRRASPAASARPIPEPAPVTAATFPSKDRVLTASLLHRLELGLRRPAVGADPVHRAVLEGGAGRGARHGIALRGVVDVAAHLALVLSLHVRAPPHGFIPEISADCASSGSVCARSRRSASRMARSSFLLKIRCALWMPVG